MVDLKQMFKTCIYLWDVDIDDSATHELMM